MTIVLLIVGLLLVASLAAGIAGLRRVPDRKVGIVYRRYSGRHPQDTFRVRLHGSDGPQAKVLPPNSWHWLTPVFNRVAFVPQTQVPDSTIGVVEALAGRVRPAGRRMSQYVECDYFQDGEAFLRGGGEQGRQLGYLPGGGWYSINTELFRVVTVNNAGHNPHDDLVPDDLREVEIREGFVGVVITLDGKPPSRNPDETGHVVQGHYSYRLPWVFLGRGGQRGVQEETLESGGGFTINPWFARVVQIPTLDLILDWTKKSLKNVGNFDSALDKIVVDIQGYQVSLEMSQVLRIPAAAAPRLVRRFGESEKDLVSAARGGPHMTPAPVRRFVERVLGAAVAGYFTEIVAEYGVLRFIREYDKVRLRLQDRVTNELADWNVIAGGTILGAFESENPELSRLRRVLAELDLRHIAAARERPILEEKQLNQKIETEMERILIDLEGQREVVKLAKQIEVLGKNAWLMERLIATLPGVQVPHYVSSGSGDLAERMLGLMPFHTAQDMLKSLIQSAHETQTALAADSDVDAASVPGDVAETAKE